MKYEYIPRPNDAPTGFFYVECNTATANQIEKMVEVKHYSPRATNLHLIFRLDESHKVSAARAKEAFEIVSGDMPDANFISISRI